MLVKEFSFSKVAGLQLATLPKNKFPHDFFSKVLSAFSECLF